MCRASHKDFSYLVSDQEEADTKLIFMRQVPLEVELQVFSFIRLTQMFWILLFTITQDCVQIQYLWPEVAMLRWSE